MATQERRASDSGAFHPFCSILVSLVSQSQPEYIRPVGFMQNVAGKFRLLAATGGDRAKRKLPSHFLLAIRGVSGVEWCGEGIVRGHERRG